VFWPNNMSVSSLSPTMHILDVSRLKLQQLNSNETFSDTVALEINKECNPLSYHLMLVHIFLLSLNRKTFIERWICIRELYKPAT